MSAPDSSRWSQCPNCGEWEVQGRALNDKWGSEQGVFECDCCGWRAFDGTPEYDAHAQRITEGGVRPLNAKDRRKRLLVLADFLEREVLPRLDGAKFNMADWGSTETGEKPTSIKDTSACGFEGCAVGWAYYCPALVRAGIRRHVTWASWGMAVNYKTIASFFGLQWDINGDDELDEAFVPSSVSAIERGRTGLRKVVRRLRKIASRGVRRG